MKDLLTDVNVIQTLLRAVLKVGGGAMMARGLATDNEVEAIAAGLAALVGVIWGIRHRKDLRGPGFEVNGKDGLKELAVLVGVVLMGMVVTGCASANAVAFRTEKLLTDTAYGAVVVWKSYYAMEVTNRPAEKVGELEKQNAQVFEASRRFAAAMTVADGIRESAATNASASNRTALQIALNVGREQSSNVVWLVKSYIEDRR